MSPYFTEFGRGEKTKPLHYKEDDCQKDLYFIKNELTFCQVQAQGWKKAQDIKEILEDDGEKEDVIDNGEAQHNISRESLSSAEPFAHLLDKDNSSAVITNVKSLEQLKADIAKEWENFLAIEEDCRKMESGRGGGG